MNGRASRLGPSGPIYAIADLDALRPTPVPAAVAAMAEAGIRWIQLRAKGLSGAGWYDLVADCCRALEGSAASLWIDDRADVAALFPRSPIAGLHVGQTDLPPAAARRAVGEDVAIGVSTHGLEQILAAHEDTDVDVIAVGPVFPTTGKADPGPVVGLPFVRRARQATPKPLVAIGGIAADNVSQVLAAGADAAAVLGAICRGDVGRNCRLLLAAAGGG